MVLYMLNSENSLLPEIEGIVKKTIGIESMLSEELGKVKGIVFAFLFGSYVKGGFRDSSDIDIYVIGDVHEDALVAAIVSVEKIVQRDINYHLSSMAEFMEKRKKSYFVKEIVSQCRVIVGDENEFAAIAT